MKKNLHCHKSKTTYNIVTIYEVKNVENMHNIVHMQIYGT
jgi:hypothetical protein